MTCLEGEGVLKCVFSASLGKADVWERRMALPVTHEGGPLCPQFPARGFPYTGIAEPQGQTVTVPFR